MMFGIVRQKYYCPVCGWAAKGICPRHPAETVPMGVMWRPGKKGSKTRLWDDRVHGRRQDARRVMGGSKSKHHGWVRTASDHVIALGGRDRLRQQTGAGFLRMGDPVTEAIHARPGSRRKRRNRGK